MSEATLPVVMRLPRADRATTLRYFARRNPRMIIGGTLIVFLLFIAVFAPIIAPFDPIQVRVADSLLPPGSPGHLLGTDDLGRDVLSRVIWGARASMQAGVFSTLLAVAVAVPVGLVAGYYRGWFDSVISRATDTLLAFPYLIVAVGLAA